MQSNCKLHAAFPLVHENVLHRKRMGLDVWAEVVYYHFEVHLNYDQIKVILWHDWQVRVSRNAVRDMCEQFEVAAARVAEGETAEAVQANEYVVLALDGAQPDKDCPALWNFTDLLTHKLLLARILPSASAAVLGEIFGEIQEKFGVPIVAVLSDRQDSIVLAVEQYLPGVPHAFCHFHFLRNMAKPAAARDAVLKDALKVRITSIVKGLRQRAKAPGNEAAAAARALAPLVEELRCATSAQGDHIRVLPGIEIYANLDYVRGRLETFLAQSLPAAARKEIQRVHKDIAALLFEQFALNQETVSLALDLGQLRAILACRGATGAVTRERVARWRARIEHRLARLGLPTDPALFKCLDAPATRSIPECWQECLRVLYTHEPGLYVAYEVEGLEFTNNGQEHLFSRDKKHFRSLYGNMAMGPAFQAHGPLYSHIVGESWEPVRVGEVLWACDEAYITSGVASLRARYATTRREWRIRSKYTGNWVQLLQNLADLEAT
jgi:hypothetical protein